MKYVYPVVLTPVPEGWYAVWVPDLDIDTQGESIADAMDMARDVISLWACTELDRGHEIPQPSDVRSIIPKPEAIVTLVDIDLEVYRLELEMEKKVVNKNLSIPLWLSVRAEEAGLDFSIVLSDALRDRLGI